MYSQQAKMDAKSFIVVASNLSKPAWPKFLHIHLSIQIQNFGVGDIDSSLLGTSLFLQTPKIQHRPTPAVFAATPAFQQFWKSHN